MAMLNNAKGYNSDNLLQEVKKGHCGSGLLLERDGHIYDGKDTIKQMNEDIKNHHEFVCPDHFVVSAVFQKYGIKNANGRIYPENILRREVERYIKERVKTRCAFGALDHPSCQLADTKILTEKGWKDIADVQVGENVLTRTPDGRIEIHPVLRKIDEAYEGDMVHFQNRFLNYTVTPLHKIPVFDSKKEYKGLFTAQEIYEQALSDQEHCYFSRKGSWHNYSDEYALIPKLSDDEISAINDNQRCEEYKNDLLIPMETWMKFIGLYLANGWCSFNDKDKYIGNVSFSYKDMDIIETFKDMMTEFPLPYTEIIDDMDNSHIFNVSDVRLFNYVDQMGDYFNKHISYDIKKQGKDMLRVLYDWFIMGSHCDKSEEITTISKQLALDFNEIQMKIGYTGTFVQKNLGHNRVKYISHRKSSLDISLSNDRTQIYKKYYKGRVYCIEIENHTFYTMDSSGNCLWTGNSTTLSGHDVTHNILNLEWQGHTLVGEMELHLSPGYKKYGICSTSGDLVANMLLSNYLVGVSSRGVGTVIQKPGNVLMVDDDFDLIGWDVVLEPSTPNANIGLSREDLQPFIENKVSDKKMIDEQLIYKCLNIL